MGWPEGIGIFILASRAARKVLDCSSMLLTLLSASPFVADSPGLVSSGAAIVAESAPVRGRELIASEAIFDALAKRAPSVWWRAQEIEMEKGGRTEKGVRTQ